MNNDAPFLKQYFPSSQRLTQQKARFDLLHLILISYGHIQISDSGIAGLITYRAPNGRYILINRW